MATIQVRGVPEEVHRTFKRRAGAAGMSLQEYVLAGLCEEAGTKTPAEVMAEVEEHIRRDPSGFSAGPSSADIIREDRESH